MARGEQGREDQGRQPLPTGALVAAGLVVALLVLVGGRYGFHRDELYFIEGGRHPAPAQPDNPMLVPFFAAGWHDLVGGRLWAFRILPALAAGAYVLVGAAAARELGGASRHQTAAAVLTALTGIVLATGHLFSTTTFDMTLTAAAVWLLLRALRTGGWGPWIALGLVTGVAMETKVLAAAVLTCCLAGVLALGPRRVLASPRPRTAVVIALGLAAPNLAWQWSHDWPMASIAGSIAAGGSTSSDARSTIVLMHLLQVGPVVSVALVTGVVWLLRGPQRHRLGWLAAAYLLFLVLVVVGGGKAYYPAPLVPALLAAAAVGHLDGLTDRARRGAVRPALVVSALVTPVLTLPLAPVGSAPFGIATAVNPDAAETVGWEDHVRTVHDVVEDLPEGARSSTVVLTRNYGEAGALSRARRLADDSALPPVYSGHNAWALWGPRRRRRPTWSSSAASAPRRPRRGSSTAARPRPSPHRRAWTTRSGAPRCACARARASRGPGSGRA